jgi:transposase
MCDTCVDLLEKSYSFKERCIEIHDKLQNPPMKAEKFEGEAAEEESSSYFVNDELVEYEEESVEADPLVKEEDEDYHVDAIYEEPEKLRYRTRYTPKQKEKIMKAAESSSNKEASKQFGVDQSCIRKWRAKLTQPTPSSSSDTLEEKQKPETETPRVVKKRRAYTAGWKLEVVNYAEVTGNRQAAKIFGIDESCIRKWRVAKEMLIEINRERGTKRKPNLHWADLEKTLKNWVLQQMNNGHLLKPKEIREKSLEIAKEMNIDNFRGTSSYIFKFMERYHIPGREVKKGAKKKVKEEVVYMQA